MTIGGNLYVSYALQDAEKHDDVSGAGHGAISVFNPNGKLVASLVKVTAGGPLNSPWGLALAPPLWGKLGGALLVGNFGDGAIHAFDPDTGAFKGELINPATGAPLAVDGLWALAFGSQNPDAGILPNQLFFTAGPNVRKTACSASSRYPPSKRARGPEKGDDGGAASDDASSPSPVREASSGMTRT